MNTVKTFLTIFLIIYMNIPVLWLGQWLKTYNLPSLFIQLLCLVSFLVLAFLSVFLVETNECLKE